MPKAKGSSTKMESLVEGYPDKRPLSPDPLLRLALSYQTKAVSLPSFEIGNRNVKFVSQKGTDDEPDDPIGNTIALDSPGTRIDL